MEKNYYSSIAEAPMGKGETTKKKKSKKTKVNKNSKRVGGKTRGGSEGIKTYSKSSMFAKAADNRDRAKTSVGKARPFGSAFKSAKDAGKSNFLWKGKSYHTKTKSELEAAKKVSSGENRDTAKTSIGSKGSMSSAKPTGPNKPKRTLGSLLKKIGSKLKKKK
tara:strand:- start:64 stop:552 length:489 start_codon:yes stop_codon:yes gene_type:complete